MRNKHLLSKVLLLVAVMLAGVGTAWGETVEWDLSKASYDYDATADKVTWSSDFVSMVLTKGSSQTSANNYLGGSNYYTHTRVYKDQVLTWTPAQDITISSIVITSTASSYTSGLKDGTWTNGSATSSETTITVTPTAGTSAVSCVIKAAARVTKVVVTYTAAAASPLASIALSGDYPTSFYVGDAFSHEGMTVTATFEDESTQDVTSSATFSGYDPSTTGSQTITVSYTAGEVTKTATYNITVNAVVPETGGWVETSISELAADDVFVIVGDNSNTYALTNDNGTGSAPAAVEVTVNEGKITSLVADNMKWTISGNATGGYTFYPYGDTTTWLYCTNTNNGVRVGTNDNKTFIIKEDYLYHNGTSRYVGIYNSQDWRCYTSNGGNIADQTFAFYRLVDDAAVKAPVITVAGTFVGSTTATITCSTEGATIYYSFDNSTWKEYTEALTITATTTIYAKAVKDENESTVVSKTTTKQLPTPTVTVSGDLTLDLNGETNVSAGVLSATVTYDDAPIQGATVTWSSSSPAVATINASTGAVTLLTKGEVTFTATYAGVQGQYNEATGTMKVTVIDSKARGSEANPYTVAEVIDGTATGSGIYVKGFIVGCYVNNSFTRTDLSVNTNLALADNAGETDIEKIIPVDLPSGDRRTALNVLDKPYNVDVAQILYKGNAQKYFGVNGVKGAQAGTVKIAEQVSITAAGMATYYTDCALDFTGLDNMWAYTATLSGDAITFTRINAVPVNTGVLLYNPNNGAATNVVPVAEEPETVSGNKFVGTLTDITVSGENKYILNNGSKGLGFYKVKANGSEVGAHRAYLDATGASSRAFIGFADNGATGIESLQGNSSEQRMEVYNLQGVRVQQPTKGLYIMNGKKVIFK